MKKILSLILALVMVLSLAACGNSQSSNASNPGNSNSSSSNSSGSSSGTSGSNESGGPSSIAVSIASEPDTIDPALNSAVDGATLVSHLFSGLAKWAQDANGNLEIVADAAEELIEGVVGADGKVTYTYTIKDGVTWSDGQPVTAGDFEFAWNRAAGVDLAADYGYMFEVVDGYAEIWETDDAGNFVNPDAKLNVHALDDKTLEVTLANAVAYWDELLAFPTYFPVREDVVANDAWATDPSTYVSNGAYTMTGWDHNSVITMEKSPYYHDTDSILMDKIEFYLSDDANNMLTNFQNGTWLLIDDVPTNEIASLKANYPDEFVVAGQIGTYYTCWNVNEDILPASNTLTGVEAEQAKAEVRKALALLLDRNYIVEEIGQAGQVPASSFVAMGMTNPDGSQFYQTAGTSSSYDGYYDVSADALESNYASAIETLKKYYAYDESTGMFTDFPSVTYLYNTSEGHKAIGEYIQAALGSVGITMNLENQEWNTFLNTRKNGDYSMARNGWLADYNDPICFLDMWVTGSGNNDIQYGKGDHANLKMYDLDLTAYGYDTKVENGTWSETYDVLISAIKSCTDDNNRYAMMHIAEDMLMDTGCIVPLYFYTDIYMLDDSVHGFFSNPLGYKYFMYCTID
ncbi:MAG: peptide ABC transporter substrate-binding protein [Butyricicoccus sp.]|nr:peptide ABC transporter substrate-binding protein [Butyricicoccus sp.]